MRIKAHVFLASCAGFFGSLGSVAGKLSGSVGEFLPVNDNLQVTIGFGLFIAMLAFNAYGLTLFAKSLRFAPNSLESTIISSAVNYLVSALFGMLLFKETTTLLWWFGTGLVLLGIVVITVSDVKQKKR